MRISTRSLLLACVLCAPISSTKAQDTSSTTAPLRDAFNWKLRLAPGQKWQMRMFMRMDQTVGSATSQPQARVEVKLIQRGTLDYEVLSVDAQGAHTARLTYRDFGGNVSFSQNGQQMMDTKTQSQINRLYRSLQGASFTLKQAPDGTVWNVLGMDAIRKRLTNAAPGLSAEERALIEASAGQFASDKQMKTMMRSVGGQLPTQPVRVGETWNYNVDVPATLPFAMKINGTRTLKSRANGVALIGESATFDVPAPKPTANPARKTSEPSVEMRGSMQGFTRVDEATGMALETQMEQRFTGTVSEAHAGSAPVPLVAKVQMRFVMAPQN